MLENPKNIERIEGCLDSTIYGCLLPIVIAEPLLESLIIYIGSYLLNPDSQFTSFYLWWIVAGLARNALAAHIGARIMARTIINHSILRPKNPTD